VPIELLNIPSGLAITATGDTFVAIDCPVGPLAPTPQETVPDAYTHSPNPNALETYTASETSPPSITFLVPKTPAENVKQVVFAPARQILAAPHESEGKEMSSTPVSPVSFHSHTDAGVTVVLTFTNRRL